MKNILVTGCSSGIGYCVALRLKERGYKVYATARNEDDLQRLRDKGLVAMPLDYADPESVDDLANELMLRTNNDIYAVFHNGAYGQPGAVEDLSRAVIEEQFASNVFGWIQLTNRLIPLMRHVNAGRIIFNSSVLGLISLPYRGAYNASKYAIEGFADTLRLELMNTNIRVSLIEPGPIESRFRANGLIKFKQHIDTEGSFHHQQYKTQLARLEEEGVAVPFTLPPEAVAKKVEHALSSSRPRVHYYVTFPTYLFATLKRILPASWLDRLLLKVAGDK
ncbi:MAG: SDR family oxidoreductase [Thiotrichaceae bacterium]|nr:SDR family oxidoreductase [Thiotrichaceae bacterium]